MAAPCMGAVLHTLNIRLFPEQLTYIANHAQDKVIFVDDSLVPLLEKVAPTFETVEHYVVVGDGDAGSLPNVLRYEELLAAAAAGLRLSRARRAHGRGPLLHERHDRQPEGRPVLAPLERAALPRHRASPTRPASPASDRVLPVVPMFHVNAWGFPYACAMVGRRPGDAGPLPPGRAAGEADRVGERHGRGRRSDDLDGPAARTRTSTSPTSPACAALICGGAAVPESLMRAFEERHGVRIMQGWGMTETSPLGAVARPPAGRRGRGALGATGARPAGSCRWSRCG